MVAAKRAHHIRYVMQGIASLPYAPDVDRGLDVDVWRYLTSVELDYVALLCPLPAVRLDACRGRFNVNVGTI